MQNDGEQNRRESHEQHRAELPHEHGNERYADGDRRIGGKAAIAQTLFLTHFHAGESFSAGYAARPPMPNARTTCGFHPAHFSRLRAASLPGTGTLRRREAFEPCSFPATGFFFGGCDNGARAGKITVDPERISVYLGPHLLCASRNGTISPSNDGYDFGQTRF